LPIDFVKPKTGFLESTTPTFR